MRLAYLCLLASLTSQQLVEMSIHLDILSCSTFDSQLISLTFLMLITPCKTESVATFPLSVDLSKCGQVPLWAKKFMFSANFLLRMKMEW